MRWRGVNHVELSVLDYENSIAFYDKMFGWLGYKSFWSLDIGYRSTYYMARFPMPHSYIGFQPAKSGEKLVHEERKVGLHHFALWARSKKEVNEFYQEFLLSQGIEVTEKPAAYDVYTPGYYAVFFNDPINGFHWELAYVPRIPSLGDYLRWKKALKNAKSDAITPGDDIVKKAMRKLPTRSNF